MRSRIVMSNAWGRSGNVVRSGARSAGGLEAEARCGAADSRYQVRLYNYALSPGSCVGSEAIQDKESEPFEELFPELVDKLRNQSADSHLLTTRTAYRNLSEILLDGYIDVRFSSN